MAEAGHSHSHGHSHGHAHSHEHGAGVGHDYGAANREYFNDHAANYGKSLPITPHLAQTNGVG